MKKILYTVSFFSIGLLISCQKSQLYQPATLQAFNKSGLITDSIYIGAPYQGGIIFWIDSTGEHGLIASYKDQTLGIPWADNYGITGADLKQVGRGRNNTRTIVKHLGRGTYAAMLCTTYFQGDYKDWFLPSLKELKLLFENRKMLGMTDVGYWSSSELDSTQAYAYSFSTSAPGVGDKKRSFLAVRAIRIF